jgi:hypothetical protein
MPPLTQKSTLHGQLIAIPDAVIIPLGKIANGYHVCFTQRHESMRVAVWPFSSPLWQKWSSAAIARARSVSVSRATRSRTRVEQRQLRHHSLLRRAGDPTWARVGLDRTAIKRPNQQTRVRAVFIGASSSATARFRQHLWINGGDLVEASHFTRSIRPHRAPIAVCASRGPFDCA